VGGPVTINWLYYSSSVFSGSVALPVTLARGQSLTVTVSAKPEATLTRAGLTIGTSVGKQLVYLTETAPQSSVSLSSTSLTFNGSSGSVSSQPLRITAVGGPVTISWLYYSSSVFSGSVALPVTLARGQSLTVTVSAKPEATLTRAGLTMGTSVGRQLVYLTETAPQPTTSHSVALSWHAPSSSPEIIDSYDVERAAAGSTSYSRIATTAASSTVWNDTTVKAGGTYKYEVVARGANGDTSAPSNPITVTIP
jgi:hypothetical protein